MGSTKIPPTPTLELHREKYTYAEEASGASRRVVVGPSHRPAQPADPYLLSGPFGESDESRHGHAGTGHQDESLSAPATFFQLGFIDRGLHGVDPEEGDQTGQTTLLDADARSHHWKLGQTDLNLLCLGLLHQDVSIPLESVSLGKAGNSNTKERKKLFRKAWRYLKDYSCCLLADREFVGIEWLSFLLGLPGLEFIIRIRCDGWITFPNGKKRALSLLVRNLHKGKTRIYENVILYEQSDKVRVHLVCHRSQKGELVLLATHRSDLEQVLDLYKTRWSIETAFGFLKSKGFDLEETHLTKPKRIQLLMRVLSLTLLWGLLVGIEAHQHKPITVKKYGRKAISFVRLGLDHLQDAITNIDDQWKEFRHYCRILLSCT